MLNELQKRKIELEDRITYGNGFDYLSVKEKKEANLEIIEINKRLFKGIKKRKG